MLLQQKMPSKAINVLVGLGMELEIPKQGYAESTFGAKNTRLNKEAYTTTQYNDYHGRAYPHPQTSFFILNCGLCSTECVHNKKVGCGRQYVTKIQI